ncbi:hypothetical protein P7M46_06440 [Bisgaard Taxon 10/6]|uniref:Uncharacterized protein n=1 Tax=Exercitatus varius TaxID=67857 RepID=A0AAW6QC63_9PAST|nr:hypothetical protein [Exercitatus varius]QOF67048.1 hypothetical protein IFE17_07695 [Actinobacillus sp. GY-402]MDG2917642.1 hypothetical protein [Exercitatus varius]MDG2941768.1 hypothetical protein [Exercitatus varius]MDG2947489.1 hypothetical protein [Exercitatus varius]MDG2949917.1 hypothetical protein [Exercitatus varius]
MALKRRTFLRKTSKLSHLAQVHRVLRLHRLKRHKRKIADRKALHFMSLEND